MSEASDSDLLRRYVERGDEAAFTMLGKRYERLVYSVCLREITSPDLAADAAQETFLLLAQDARKLSSTRHSNLAGWLFSAARNVARNARRGEVRRKSYEEAATMEELRRQQEEQQQAWTDVESHLNEALAAMPSSDRQAILLRFFAQKSLAEVGAGLGVSENAAQMRVHRALERLRGQLIRLGIIVSVTMLWVVLEKHAAVAAPAGFEVRLVEVAKQGKLTSPGVKQVSKQAPIMVYLGAVLVGMILAGSMVWVSQVSLPQPPQVDEIRLAELERYFEGTWQGSETDSGGRSNPVTIRIWREPRRLLMRFEYPKPRETIYTWLSVEKRTGRVVVEGRDVLQLSGPSDGKLSLEGWNRSSTGKNINWAFVRQSWQKDGDTLIGRIDSGSPLTPNWIWKLHR